MNGQSLRLDKWLWYARFFKSRTLASKVCDAGRVRINGTVVTKAHYKLSSGEILTFPKGDDIRVIKVVQLGTRRGPAVEAQALYEDLDPPQARSQKIELANESSKTSAVAIRDRGTGRPTKSERRALQRLLPDAGDV